ncbi:cobalamin biosynthesis protein [Marinivivus vitaminiproducens]|uniref:cobalamin biosynthesis protein n=1 Tax=Marinivivus vitaminiproducens TaxID=3035935 RepID=UPI0027A7C190|nr:cobalamin biosynthesis protein [Geminicoccaceae bacterium SCSIO 64248]
MTERTRAGKLALGVGCERGAPPAPLRALVEDVLARRGIDRQRIAVVASIDAREDEPAVLEVAALLGAATRFYPAETLEAMTPRLAHPSDRVFRHVGCHGVAEAAALAAAGEAAVLQVEKTVGRGCTVAIAGPVGDKP